MVAARASPHSGPLSAGSAAKTYADDGGVLALELGVRLPGVGAAGGLRAADEAVVVGDVVLGVFVEERDHLLLVGAKDLGKAKLLHLTAAREVILAAEQTHGRATVRQAERALNRLCCRVLLLREGGGGIK